MFYKGNKFKKELIYSWRARALQTDRNFPILLLLPPSRRQDWRLHKSRSFKTWKKLLYRELIFQKQHLKKTSNSSVKDACELELSRFRGNSLQNKPKMQNKMQEHFLVRDRVSPMHLCPIYEKMESERINLLWEIYQDPPLLSNRKGRSL